jgi:exonuclease VII small subunit
VSVEKSSELAELETQLQQAEQLLQEVRQRLLQIETGESDRATLQQQQIEIGAEIKQNQTADQKIELKKQLAQITDQLEMVEAQLESRLLSWDSFREPFWQIVRFGGLGVLLGVLLKSCAG